MSWHDEMPSPNSEAMIDKLFELARIPLGMLEEEFSDEWEEWLTEARKHVRLGERQISKEKQDQKKRNRLLAQLRKVGGSATLRPCSFCGLTGHNKRTCPKKNDPSTYVDDEPSGGPP